MKQLKIQWLPFNWETKSYKNHVNKNHSNKFLQQGKSVKSSALVHNPTMNAVCPALLAKQAK